MTGSRSTELPGLPAGARIRLVSCGDLGLHATVDTAIVRAVEQGVARGCSPVQSGPAAAHAVRLLRDRPEVRR